MRKLKKAVVLLICGLCFMGCTGTNQEKTGNNLSSELKQLNIKQFEKRMKDKDEFVVMISQSTCSHCNTMKRTLIPYFREHTDIAFFELEMDMLGDKVMDTEENFSKLKKLVPSFSGGTPEYLYYKDGTLQKQQGGEMSEIAWNNFMIDCGLIKGDKLKEKVIDYSIAESEQFKESTLQEIAKLIRDKKDFYFYFAAEDRYNVDFSKKLKKYVEKNKIEIVLLNNTQVKQPVNEKESQDMSAAVEIINETMTIEFAPTVFHIKNGKQIEVLKDNVTEKELKEWFEKQ